MTTTAIKERPILFSGPMVRAILAGKKTQTRRVIGEKRIKRWQAGSPIGQGPACIYGVPGDRLWVRETFFDNRSADGDTETEWLYRADGEIGEQDETGEGFTGWRPSIFMPRSACRIVLEVTATRVERVQEISGFDARDEGFPIGEDVPDCDVMHFGGGKKCKAAFRELWEKLNGPRGYGWDVNPWVWVVSFKRIQKPGAKS